MNIHRNLVRLGGFLRRPSLRPGKNTSYVVPMAQNGSQSRSTRSNRPDAAKLSTVQAKRKRHLRHIAQASAR